MTTMDATATLNEFAHFTADFAPLAALPRVIASVAKKWFLTIIALLLAVLLSPLLTVILIAIQFIPYLFKKQLEKLSPAIPYIKGKDNILLVRDMFELSFYAIKGYRSLCLFKKTTDQVMDDLEEQLDTISYVLQNEDFLKNAMLKIESRH